MSNESTPLLGISSSIPVTVLSGFLGSGKTTLLAHILNTNAGNTSLSGKSCGSSSSSRIAVLVNDMGKINIDAALVKKGPGSAFGGKTSGMVELSNGCICCTLQADLIQELQNLVKASTIDYIVVEGSGIAEPKPIANIFNQTGSDKWKVHLDTLVTVVDSQKFLQDYRGEDNATIGTRSDLRQAEGASEIDCRLIVELLINQIEVANVIILNKTDLITSDQLLELQQLIQSLNPGAKILQSEFSRVPLINVLGTGLFSKSSEPSTSTKIGRQYESSYSGQAGILSFSIFLPKPFHPQKLHNLIVTWKTKKIVRSKGFAWIASSKKGIDDFAYWAHAGNHLRLEKRDHPGTAGESQLVFIGINMSEKGIRDALDKCTLNPEEMNIFNEQSDAWGKYLSENGGNPIRLSKEPWKLIKDVEKENEAHWIHITFILSIVTIFYNSVEGIVSLYYGLSLGTMSNTMLSLYGMDSLLEIFSASAVLFRFRHDISGSIQDRTDTISQERKSTFAIGVLFALLCLSSLTAGIYGLIYVTPARSFGAGLIISSVSITGMFCLFYSKLYASIALQSRTIEADAMCSLGCVSISFVVLVGSLLEMISSALWWVNPVGTMIIGIFFGREGAELIHASMQPVFDGCCHGEENRKWRIYKHVHNQLRDGAGTLKLALEALHVQEKSPLMTRSGGKISFTSPVPKKSIDELQVDCKKAEEKNGQKKSEVDCKKA